MPPDRVSGKPHHAREPQSIVFSSVDGTEQGGLANMTMTFQSFWEAGKLMQKEK